MHMLGATAANLGILASCHTTKSFPLRAEGRSLPCFRLLARYAAHTLDKLVGLLIKSFTYQKNYVTATSSSSMQTVALARHPTTFAGPPDA